MTRRDLLAVPAAAATAAALSAQTLPGPRANTPRPNVLWILAEDISPQLSCYGEPLVQTPNLDKLAAEGARYTQAFTTAPVCSPSRSALITGMYQTSIGAHNHRTFDRKPLPPPVKIGTDHFRQAGYFTVLSRPDAGTRPAQAGWLGSGKTDFNFAAPKPFDGYDWKQRANGQPFFAQLSLAESHKGYGWKLALKEPNLVDPNKVKLPPYWPDHPIARQEYANYLDSIQLVDRYMGIIQKRLEEEKLVDNTVVFFMGDNGSCLFRGKQFLYEGGISVPFIARWPGHIKPGTVNNNLWSAIDMTAASLAIAGVEPPSYMQGRNFLAPGYQGRDLIFAARDRCDIAIERMRCVRDKRYKYIRNFLPGIPYMQANPYKEQEYPTWNLVKQLYREGKLNSVQSLFAADHKPVEEFFDLQADPHEINNLAKDPAQKQRVDTMRAALDGWIKESGDRGAVMEDPVPIYEDFFKPKANANAAQ